MQKGDLQENLNTVRRMRFVMGTFLRIQLNGDDVTKLTDAVSIFLDDVQNLEAWLSIYQETSDIALVNAAAGHKPVHVHRLTLDVIRHALRWAEMTRGAFDPTVHPLVEGLGFGAREKPERLPSLDKTMVDFRKVTINYEEQTLFLPRAGMGLDLGGIGKGFALDQAIDRLRKKPGIKSARIDFGGQLFFWDRSGSFAPETVMIESPGKIGKILASFTVGTSCSVSTSSNGERAYHQFNSKTNQLETIGHLLDPRAGKPAFKNESVTVIAANATDAEALSTALFVMNESERASLLESYTDARVFVTPT